MTPNNIAGMAVINGLNVVALTDHNTSKNCPAFFKACKKSGIIPIAGMELTTSEDIHIVCLFEELEAAMAFDEQVSKSRNLIENRTDIFGNQLILDENDEIVKTEKYLLPNATNLSLEEGVRLARKFGAVCYPAHIDRDANGIVATLGIFPETPDFSCVEYRNSESRKDYESRFPILREKSVVVSSDAHYLWDINENQNFFEIDDEPYSSSLVRHKIFEILKNKH